MLSRDQESIQRTLNAQRSLVEQAWTLDEANLHKRLIANPDWHQASMRAYEHGEKTHSRILSRLKNTPGAEKQHAVWSMAPHVHEYHRLHGMWTKEQAKERPSSEMLGWIGSEASHHRRRIKHWAGQAGVEAPTLPT